MNKCNLSKHEYSVPVDYYYEADHTTNPKPIVVKSHSHSHYEIYMYISGEVKIMLNNHIFNVIKGDIVIVPPYNIHSLISVDDENPYERMYLYVTETCLSSLQFKEHSLLKPLLDAAKRGIFHFHVDSSKDYEVITYAIDRIRDSKRQNNYGKEMMNRSYILQLFTIINYYITKEVSEKPINETNSLISQVVDYFNENFMENITLDTLCERFYTNRQTLTKLFKEHTTMTIHSYITLMRITKAKKLICKGTHPSKVYLMCGFNDYTTFYRAFKKIEGITPQQFGMR